MNEYATDFQLTRLDPIGRLERYTKRITSYAKDSAQAERFARARLAWRHTGAPATTSSL